MCNNRKLTKNRRLLVGTNIMEGLVKEVAKFLCQDSNECLSVLVINKTITEHSETFMDPQTCHGGLRVMEVLVGSQ